MDLLLSLLFFLIGVTFGSFFNVVGLRMPKNESFTVGRSYCPTCKKTLHWYELIPVLSYLIQGGKCRKCNTRISPMYPVIEIATGILFLFSYRTIGLDWELAVALLLVSMLMIIFVTDIRYMIIPNKVLLFFLPFFIVLRILTPLEPWWSPIAGALAAGFLLALIILVSRGGMGAGDMKLFGVLGIILGLQNVLLALFLASFIGAVIGILLIAFKMIERKQPVPFGPFIVIGSLIAYYFGNDLLQFYLNL